MSESPNIIPEAKKGPDTDDNAAPLCSNCHTAYGGNPDLRKEITARRDHWYGICKSKYEFNWTSDFDVLTFDTYEEVPMSMELVRTGFSLITNHQRLELTSNSNNLGTQIKISLSYMPSFNNSFPRCLRVTTEMLFGFSLTTEVCALSDWDINGLMDMLRGHGAFWMLNCLPDENDPDNSRSQLRDYFSVFRMKNGENKVMIKFLMPSKGSIDIKARFTDDVLIAIAGYLEKTDFIENKNSDTAN